MEDKPEANGGEPSKAPHSTGPFGTLLQFHQRTVRLVRQSSLDSDAKVAIYERLHSLLEQLSEEIETDVVDPIEFDLQGRLQLIYDETKASIEAQGGTVQEEHNGDGV